MKNKGLYAIPEYCKNTRGYIKDAYIDEAVTIGCYMIIVADDDVAYRFNMRAYRTWLARLDRMYG